MLDLPLKFLLIFVKIVCKLLITVAPSTYSLLFKPSKVLYYSLLRCYFAIMVDAYCVSYMV